MNGHASQATHGRGQIPRRTHAVIQYKNGIIVKRLEQIRHCPGYDQSWTVRLLRLNQQGTGFSVASAAVTTTTGGRRFVCGV